MSSPAIRRFVWGYGDRGYQVVARDPGVTDDDVGRCLGAFDDWTLSDAGDVWALGPTRHGPPAWVAMRGETLAPVASAAEMRRGCRLSAFALSDAGASRTPPDPVRLLESVPSPREVGDLPPGDVPGGGGFSRGLSVPEDALARTWAALVRGRPAILAGFGGEAARAIAGEALSHLPPDAHPGVLVAIGLEPGARPPGGCGIFSWAGGAAPEGGAKGDRMAPGLAGGGAADEEPDAVVLRTWFEGAWRPAIQRARAEAPAGGAPSWERVAAVLDLPGRATWGAESLLAWASADAVARWAVSPGTAGRPEVRLPPGTARESFLGRLARVLSRVPGNRSAVVPRLAALGLEAGASPEDADRLWITLAGIRLDGAVQPYLDSYGLLPGDRPPGFGPDRAYDQGTALRAVEDRFRALSTRLIAVLWQRGLIPLSDWLADVDGASPPAGRLARLWPWRRPPTIARSLRVAAGPRRGTPGAPLGPILAPGLAPLLTDPFDLPTLERLAAAWGQRGVLAILREAAGAARRLGAEGRRAATELHTLLDRVEIPAARD